MADDLRFDAQETPVAADAWSFGLVQRVNGVVRVADDAGGALLLPVDDVVRAPDSADGALLPVSGDSVGVSGSLNIRAVCECRVGDMVRASGSLSRFDAFVARDSVRVAAEPDSASWRDDGFCYDAARLSGSLKTWRRSQCCLDDGARVSGGISTVHLPGVDDTLRVVDSFAGSLKPNGGVLARARVSDSFAVSLKAVCYLADDAAVADSLGVFERAPAYRADLDGWGLSRYDLPPLLGLAVVDNELWALSDDGVYKFGSGETVSGCLKFGAVDVSGGALAHLASCIVAYAKDETAQMGLMVGELQSGSLKTYRYRLADERADVLTNGRFLLGRGLRGRHFELALDLVGHRVHLNDVKLDCAATKRRV